MIEEKYSARPACLRAVIIDGKCFLNSEYGFPTEILRCAKVGDSVITPCDFLRLNKKVLECTLCEKDYCNKERGIGNGSDVVAFNILLLLILYIVTILVP